MKRLNVVLLCTIVLCMSGCQKPEVDFDEVFTKPTARIQGDTVILTGGPHRLASAHYVSPRAKVKQDSIYVYGIMTMRAGSLTNRVSLPSQPPQGGWKIKWVNKDGTTVEMKED